METIFDLLSAVLFVATAALLVLRLRHETPAILPYLLVAIVCAVGNWLGNNGGGLAAVALLIAGSFLTLHLASLPYREDTEEQQNS